MLLAMSASGEEPEPIYPYHPFDLNHEIQIRN